MKTIGKFAALALTVSLFLSLTACRPGDPDANGKTSETSADDSAPEGYQELYDWSVLNTASNGKGEKRSGGVPCSYYVPQDYYTTSESDRVRDGVRRIS